MKRTLLFVLLICLAKSYSNAQIYGYETISPLPVQDLYDTGLMNAAINNAREMAVRVAQIKQSVQPYRERQYQYYSLGYYREAIELCSNVYRQYVCYANDNKAISDMEILAGDCAMKIGAYEIAIDWYQTAKKVNVSGIDSRLSQVFESVMVEARNAYVDCNYDDLWNDVTIALKTGWESGECYFYYGVCYEENCDYANAKKMYKLAKNKKYAPASIALQELKRK